jgi:hypothetical protein
MGDPICKWRKVSTKNVIEIVSWLPKQPCLENDYKTQLRLLGPKLGNAFLRTGCQLSCQLGLQYVDKSGIFHPRFDHDITENEAKEYLKHWITKYYVPNPYTKMGFKKINQPVILLYAIADIAARRNELHHLEDICNTIFGEQTGNLVNVKNMLCDFSSIIHIRTDFNVSANNQNIPDYHVYNDRNDKQAFFDFFNG